MEDFTNDEKNTSAVLVTSSMRMRYIMKTVQKYDKTFVFPSNEKVVCKFIYEWSICSANRDNTTSAERLLEWMLGNVYQNYLMIGTAGNGEIPINKEAFTSKISNSEFLIGISGDSYRRFVFLPDEEGETV